MRLVSLILCFLLLGCTAPRFFQSKVPAPIVKTDDQFESERQGADLIAKTIETPVELKPVASSLSTSLGAPKKSLFVGGASFNMPVAAAHANSDLQSGILQMQHQLDVLNGKLTRLQGKDIEGTGFSILGPSTVVIIGGLIALGVFFPPAFTIIFFILRRTKAAAGIVVNEIEKAAQAPETKAAIAIVKNKILQTMQAAPQKTSDLKAVITNLKS